MALRHTSTHVDLALDLLTGPAGSLNCAFAVLSGCASLSHKRGDPVVAEVGSELAVGEGISKITSVQLVYAIQTRSCQDLPNNTHGRPHQTFAAVALLGDNVKELEDRLDERLQLGDYDLISMLISYLCKSEEQHTRRGALVGQKNTTPSIHDAFTERNNVVHHVVWEVGAGGHARGLLENLANNCQVRIEVGSDGLSDITKGLKNRRLELVGGSLFERLALNINRGIGERNKLTCRVLSRRFMKVSQ